MTATDNVGDEPRVDEPPAEPRVEPRVDDPPETTTPPQLPVPQIDLSLSMDAIFEAGSKQNTKEAEKLEKLSEENEKLDEKLKELQDRLAAAERRSQELEAQRRSQQN